MHKFSGCFNSAFFLYLLNINDKKQERKVVMEEIMREHKVCIDGRKKLLVTAVEDVESFDDEKVVIICDMGTMTVSGAGFKINKLNVDEGELIIEGEVDEVQYSDRVSSQKESGFFGKLFR